MHRLHLHVIDLLEPEHNLYPKNVLRVLQHAVAAVCYLLKADET